MGLSASDLASVRLTINSFLPDSATVARTSIGSAVRVEPEIREVHVPNFPPTFRLLRWKFVFPDGLDVRAGDSITVTGMGVYMALIVEAPQSYSVNTIAHCLMLSHSDGGVPWLTNASVTFRDPQTGEEKTADVFLAPISRDLKILPETAQYDWMVLFDRSLRYDQGMTPSNRPIAVNHQIKTDLFGTATGDAARGRSISKPIPHEILPVSTAYFGQPG